MYFWRIKTTVLASHSFLCHVVNQIRNYKIISSWSLKAIFNGEKFDFWLVIKMSASGWGGSTKCAKNGLGRGSKFCDVYKKISNFTTFEFQKSKSSQNRHKISIFICLLEFFIVLKGAGRGGVQNFGRRSVTKRVIVLTKCDQTCQRIKCPQISIYRRD